MQREADGEAGADLAHRMAVGERLAEADVEAELVVDLPDRADEARDRARGVDLVLVEERCDTMPAKLAPTRLLPSLSGRSRPNSVAMLGPALSCSTPSRSTCLRNAPLAARTEGPDGENGVSSWPSRTSSQFS